MDFGNALRELRIRNKMSQMDLAKALETSQSAITAWELNKRTPTFQTAMRIAKLFSVPVSSLFPVTEDVDETLNVMAKSLHQNPKLRLLFDRTKYLSDADLDAVLGVVAAITKERDG